MVFAKLEKNSGKVRQSLWRISELRSKHVPERNERFIVNCYSALPEDCKLKQIKIFQLTESW